jgi:hypothetical protein
MGKFLNLAATARSTIRQDSGSGFLQDAFSSLGAGGVASLETDSAVASKGNMGPDGLRARFGGMNFW